MVTVGLEGLGAGIEPKTRGVLVVAMFFAMFVIFVAMSLTLVVAGLVVAYVAYVQQGRDIPHAPRLTDAMRRAGQRWNVPTEPAEQPDPERRLHVSRGGIRGSSKR